MARRFPTALLLFLLAARGWASAMSDGPAPTTLTNTGTAVAPDLGQSLVPLYGPWKFQVGDSPTDPVTGGPLWAKADFDDSKWETVNLTPTLAVNPFLPRAAVVSGWGARGHEGYSGYAWYRIRVNTPVQPGEKIALAGPGNLTTPTRFF